MAGENRSCSAITSTGTRCKRIAMAGSEYCFAHDASTADHRSRNASVAARARRNPDEIGEIKLISRGMVGKVLDGSMDRQTAFAVTQTLNTWMRALEIERRIRETEEYGERLAALENEVERRRQRGWPTWTG